MEQLRGEIFDKSFGLMLLATLGDVISEESADSGVYNHSFEILQSAKHPTLTLEVKRGDNEQKAYMNSVIESFKLSAVAKDYIKFEAVFRGKPGTASVNIPAYIEENYFLGKDINVKLASGLSGLAGSDAVDVRSVEFNVVKNIEDDEKLGSVEPNDFLNKQVVMEGNVEMLFKNTDLMNNALNGDKKAMRLEIVNSGITIGSSSNPKLVIDLAKIKFREPLIAGDNNEVAKVTVGFKAFYSSADAKSITAILTNEQVNY